MYIDDLIHSPASHIADFANKQVELYRNDVSLQDYFEALQLDTLISPRANTAGISRRSQAAKWVLQSGNKALRLHHQRKIKADILLCPNPDLSRPAEISFLTRSLLGLAETGATILCLLPNAPSLQSDLVEKLTAAGRKGQVTFLDPTSPLDPLDARLRWRVGGMRGRAAFAKTVEILEPLELTPGAEVEAAFERLAFFVEAWERLAEWVEFDAVVTRCHWLALCAPLCRTARERGKPVITFQQGVIGHTLDVPVTASKYVAFGQPSSSFLEKLDARFFEAAQITKLPVEYINGGFFSDSLTSGSNQFDRQSLLMVDTQVNRGDFYGVEGQRRALLELGERLLASGIPLRRLVIRPHPFWTDLDFTALQRLARKYPDRCELSHPAWSLDDDLQRASVVVGILSGVLTGASACGLPAVFLSTENGYRTADLACFHSQMFEPDAAFDEIVKMLTDHQAYTEARTRAMRNGGEYYGGGKRLSLDAKFFEKLLHGKTESVPQATRFETRIPEHQRS